MWEAAEVSIQLRRMRLGNAVVSFTRVNAKAVEYDEYYRVARNTRNIMHNQIQRRMCL
jgi:hypothetical protein